MALKKIQSSVKDFIQMKIYSYSYKTNKINVENKSWKNCIQTKKYEKNNYTDKKERQLLNTENKER